MKDDEISIAVMGTELRLYLPDRASDHVQARVFQSRELYEADLLRFASTLLSRGDHVVDVGAYIGTHTVFFGAICGASVTSVEPNPRSRLILRRNVELNGIDPRVRVVEAAAGDRSGRGRIETPEDHNLGDTRFTKDDSGAVELVALDDLDLPPTRLVKIDVQGGELDVLRGARRLIARDRPALFVEAADVTSSLAVARELAISNYALVAQFGSTPTFYCVHVDEALPESSRAAILAQGIRAEIVRYASRTRDSIVASERSAQVERQGLARALENIHRLDSQLDELRAAVVAAQLREQELQDELTRALHRIESRLVSVPVREPERPKAPPRTKPLESRAKPHVAPSRPAPRSLKKLRKLVRDPEGFVRDSRSPWLKKLLRRTRT